MSAKPVGKGMGWAGVIRLGLVQSALGAVVALATSTLNRVMVVEAAMPAMLPAAFVAWHYVVQLSRPRWGHGSDMGGRRTSWIIGGMGVLALGAVMATDATLMLKANPVGGIALALAAYSLIGAGVGAAGTSVLALLASRVAPERRPAAAATTWIMMILGIVLAAGIGGGLLQPFSAARLVTVVSGIAGVAFLVTLLAVWGVERTADATSAEAAPARPRLTFRQAVAEMMTDRLARRFTAFVFVSMLAYSAQELILEPFAGLVFGMSPGQSTQLSGLQHGGVLLGMILVGVLGARLGDKGRAWMKPWTIAGCVGSALALAGVAAACVVGPSWPLQPTVFVLGFANGVFAVSAIGSMMGLAGAGGGGREGVRMGVWGAAQAGAFACGGFVGAAGVDLMRHVLAQEGQAFLAVFTAEAAVFLAAAVLAARLEAPDPRSAVPTIGLEGARG